MINTAFLCNSTSWGGLEMNILQMVKWIKAEGKQVILFCPANSKIAQEAAAAEITFYAFEQKIKYIDFWAISKVIRHLKHHQTKCLILSQSKEIASGALVKHLIGRQYGLRLLYFQQMMIGIDKKDWVHNFLYKKLDSWVVPLPEVAQNVLEHTQVSANKIELLPLAIDVEKFANRKHQKAEVRERFGLPVQAFIVGIVGRIDRQKGQEFLIRALSMLRGQGVEFSIAFFGEETKGEEGHYLPFLKALVRELNLEKQVFFVPFVEDTSLAYACLDVFVMASWAETFGMVTIEAMAAGLPVVGSYAGGTKDLIKEYKNGLFFEPRSPESLALQLVKLIKSSAFMNWLSKNAKESIREQFSHRVFLERMKAVVNRSK